MHDNTEIREYRFGTYRLSNQERRLVHDGKPVPISTRSYHLLLALVQNAGQILSKDQIIKLAWSGRVITDTALAKQMLRVRKLLDDHSRERPYIETHRGVGYRFTPAVETEVIKRPALAAHTTRRPKTWLRYAAIAVILLASYILAFQFREPEPDVSAIDQTVSLAFLPVDDSSDWLSQGGAEYLSELVSGDSLVYAVQPQREWFMSDAADKVAVELAGYPNITYSCLLDISQQANQYLVRATLRNADGVVANTEISADTLPLVFEKTGSWVRSHVQKAQDIPTQTFASPTRNPYALQSYLQGLQALRAQGDFQKAADYFRAAVSSDSDFLMAWARLARMLTDLGEQDEALSIGLTLLQNPGLGQDDSLNVETHYVVARAYMRMGDEDNAARYLRKTRDVIAASNNPYVRLDGLESLADLARLENNIEAAESFGLERLTLANKFYPVPNYLAAIHLQLASFFAQNLQLQKLLEHADKAIDLSEAGQNPNGIISGYRYLSMYNFAMNHLDQGVQMAEQAEPLLELSAASYDKAFFLQYSTLMLNLRGRFDLAEQYSSLLKALAIESNNSMYEVLADFTVLHRLYVQDEFAAARSYARSMRARFSSDAVMRSALPDVLVIDATVSARAEKTGEALALLSEFEEKFGPSHDRLRNDINRALGHIAVNQGKLQEGLQLLFEAEQAIRAKSHQSVANYVGYESLEILLDHPELDYQTVMDRLESHTDYDYHFYKLKARFKAREGKYMDAAILMQENRLRANQLWKPEDQLLLETYQRVADD